MELTSVTPELNLYDDDWPIWTYQEQLPPAKFVFDDDERRGMAIDSLVSGGCIISGAQRAPFAAVLQGARAQLRAHRGLGRPADVRHRRHCAHPARDRRQALPDARGTRIGVDPEEDKRRFHVTERGVTLVTPDMLGQPVHDVP